MQNLTTPPDCPILDAAAAVHTLTRSFTRTLRRLRRSITGCPDCPSYDDCQILDQINAVITNAIQSIQDEWQQTSALSVIDTNPT